FDQSSHGADRIPDTARHLRHQPDGGSQRRVEDQAQGFAKADQGVNILYYRRHRIYGLPPDLPISHARPPGAGAGASQHELPTPHWGYGPPRLAKHDFREASITRAIHRPQHQHVLAGGKAVQPYHESLALRVDDAV